MYGVLPDVSDEGSRSWTNHSLPYYQYKRRLEVSIGRWNKIYQHGTKTTSFLSPYSKLPISFCHQKFTKSDRLVEKLSCNTCLDILSSVYIQYKKYRLEKNIFNNEEFFPYFFKKTDYWSSYNIFGIS